MARFSGEVGFGVSVEKSPGIWEDNITEWPYFGEVVRNSSRAENGDKINDNVSVNHSISIVADEFANEFFLAIRYVEWAGALWEVTSVERQRPRLILRLGGVYNGPTPVVADAP